MKNIINSSSEVADQPPIEEVGASFTQRLRERLVDVVAQLAAGGALIIVFIYLTFASPVFLTLNNLFNIVSQTAVTAVIAIGMTFVIITSGIDLSVGSNAALSGVLGVMLIVNSGVPWPLAILGGTIIGGIIGLVNGLLINAARLSPFITTLGMMGVARGLVSIFTNSVGVYGTPDDFQLLGQGTIYGIPIPLLVVVLLALLAHLILNRTRLGRYTYAIGSNGEAARLSGIPIKRYLTLIYVIQGLLAGFAGMIASSRVNSGQPNFGIGLELDVIAAAVIGGASLFGGQGTILGTLIGAFLISIIRNGAVLLNVNIYYQNVIIGVVIWLAVFWDQFRRRKFAVASR
ncbi:ABC transporter permease [Dictyobacter arantiisoli]|uniref:Sugar ABC transporter permease n=1 Tax=Dictyobacter arantiisoli TaxID=2014874 RepID=A0A5A5TF12_9CHLR|nr:ABC transporter permease [Dictyobacter arantiisoli]GCF09663.1 sugar ABC transporter permease [Dictyobacter arantiisoli]